MKLLVTDGKGGRQEFDIAQDAATIGRGDGNAIVLKGWTIGRHQATVEARAAGFFVVDQGGMTVTEVNGKAVDKEFGPLAATDRIGIGSYQISVSGGNGAAAPSAAAAPAAIAVPAPPPPPPGAVPPPSFLAPPEAIKPAA
ncbi:MAG TPA: FHA domain-containing protein, partial [Rhodocyclaceae bacterium]